MLQEESIVEAPPLAPLLASFAASEDEVREAQRLRYEVFAREMGARVPGQELGLDCDVFDRHCDHLLVRDGETHQVVGTYRLMDDTQAQTAGSFYSATEFDLTRLHRLLPRTVEIGRACVHPDYRRGGVITLLWAALLRHILRCRYEYVIGCASVPAGADGHAAASICRILLRDHLGPLKWRVAPRRAFVLEGWDDVPGVAIPTLIRGYLRLGAFVCGEPAWDGEFKSADVLLLLPVAHMNARYVDRLSRAAA